MKKQTLHSSAALLLFFLLIVSSESARLLSDMGEDTKLHKITVELEDSSVNQLMGVEECKKEDEECLERRMVSEAHLDYIYTQQHKP